MGDGVQVGGAHPSGRELRPPHPLASRQGRLDVLRRFDIHIFRGLFFGSYKAPREILWILGVIMFLLTMATAFLGYALPWVR